MDGVEKVHKRAAEVWGPKAKELTADDSSKAERVAADVKEVERLYTHTLFYLAQVHPPPTLPSTCVAAV